MEQRHLEARGRQDKGHFKGGRVKTGDFKRFSVFMENFEKQQRICNRAKLPPPHMKTQVQIKGI